MVGGPIKLGKLHNMDIYLIQVSLLNSLASKFCKITSRAGVTLS